MTRTTIDRRTLLLRMLAAEPKELTTAEFATLIASECDRIGAIMRTAEIKAQ